MEPGEAAESRRGAGRVLRKRATTSLAGRRPPDSFINRIAGGAQRSRGGLHVWREFPAGAGLRRRTTEIAALGWFDDGALPGDTEAGTVRRLREIDGGQPDNQW